jgi:hypothetical protein
VNDHSYDSEELKSLVTEAEETLRFFSNSGKKDRECWVLDRWIAHMGLSAKDVIEGEGPDFTVDGVPIELVEVLLPGRKRTDEYRAERDALVQGDLPKWGDFVDFDTVAGGAHSWIVNSINDKATKYGRTADDWLLIVYADFHWSGHTDWSAVRASVEVGVETFREIYVLMDENRVVKIKP